MIIPTFSILNQLQEECAAITRGQLVWTPPMFASMQVFVFEDDWVEDTFNPFWWEYLLEYSKLKNRPLENNAVRGTCDEITEHCRAHFAVAMRQLLGDVDCTAGAFPTRLMIPGGESINQVPGPGGHENLVLATHKGDRVILSMYEPQNRQRTPLSDAVARGIIVRAVWV